MAVRKKRVRKPRKSRYKRGIHVSVKGGECKYRSGWELAYLNWLDSNPDVVSFEYEKLVIPYLSNVKTKKMRRYFPDFAVTYADGRLEVVEIKPSKRVHNPKVLKKTSAAGDWCRENGATFHIVTEIELKAMGIL